MIHDDWVAWDAWMEANDHLVMQGIVPSVGEVTMMSDCAPSAPTDRDYNIKNSKKFERDVANLERARLAMN